MSTITVTPPVVNTRKTYPMTHLSRGKFYVGGEMKDLFYFSPSGTPVTMSDGFLGRKPGHVCSYQELIGIRFEEVNVNIQWEYA